MTAFGVSVTGPTTLRLSLAADGGATLSGRVLDAAGNGIPNQFLQLIPQGGEFGYFSVTDATGGYNFAATPGFYFLVASGDNQNFSVQAPQFYSVQTGNFELATSEIIDLRLPVVHANVHVQRGGGAAVAGAGLSTSNAFNCELTFGPAPACGVSNYSFSGSTPAAGTTDGGGNVTLFCSRRRRPARPATPSPRHRRRQAAWRMAP